MRHLQRVLLAVGVPALGTTVGGLGLAILTAVTLFRPRPGQDPSLNWGGVGMFLCCGVLGGACGAAVGAAGAVRLMRRTGDDLWSPATWIGVAVGCAAAWAARSFGLLGHHIVGDLIRWWPAAACFVAACGTLGGFAGAVLWNRTAPRSAKPRVKRRLP